MASVVSATSCARRRLIRDVLQKMKSCLSALVTLFLAAGFVHAQRADELSGVSISPPGHGWFVQISPDGSVRASFGSSPQHQIQMQKGSVNFSSLVEDIQKVMTEDVIPGGSQVALQRKGESSHRSRYLRDDQFLRRLFPSDPAAWKTIIPRLTKDMKPDGLHIAPITKEMADLMAKTPIFPKKTAEQAGTGQPATRPESKSEGSEKPQPEAEGRSR
jgi:hypothetical protein